MIQYPHYVHSERRDGDDGGDENCRDVRYKFDGLSQAIDQLDLSQADDDTRGAIQFVKSCGAGKVRLSGAEIEELVAQYHCNKNVCVQAIGVGNKSLGPEYLALLWSDGLPWSRVRSRTPKTSLPVTEVESAEIIPADETQLGRWLIAQCRDLPSHVRKEVAQNVGRIAGFVLARPQKHERILEDLRERIVNTQQLIAANTKIDQIMETLSRKWEATRPLEFVS
jgi:hypothetical protein